MIIMMKMNTKIRGSSIVIIYENPISLIRLVTNPEIVIYTKLFARTCGDTVCCISRIFPSSSLL